MFMGHGRGLEAVERKVWAYREGKGAKASFGGQSQLQRNLDIE